MLVSFTYSGIMLFSFRNIVDNNTSTEVLSRDYLRITDDNCVCQVTTCAKLITNELRGIVCVDHANNSVVRID